MPINGFLLIDKPEGINSFKLVIALRKISNQKRVGYAGTLDPLASGLMILALGEYTKLLPYLEAADKVYQVGIKFGEVSDSYDADGQISPIEVSEKPTLKIIKEELARNFQGKIRQIPPRFSAIQIGGKRAYDLARKGEQFELKERPVQIFSTEVLDYSYPYLNLEIHCSSGTYIRSFAHQLGENLKCGGLVSKLRRTKIGKLSVEDSFPLASLNLEVVNKIFVSPREIFKGMSQIELEKSQYEVLSKGNFIENPELLSGEALGFFENQLVGIIETTENGRKLKFKKKLHIF